MRCIGRLDDLLIVRGVNVYPTAILSVVGDFRPRVTGRARVIRSGADVSVTPPVPVEVEVPDGQSSDGTLAAEIAEAIHAKLVFRSKVTLIPEAAFGESGYKTKLTVSRP
jgi:phenylacetate-CoA ligase